MADWTEKYRPESLSEIRGNDSARDEFREWAETWDDHREAVVVHGSPGIGKTSAAHALANDMGWETVELNASDQRTADVIERFAGRAARNATLGGSARGTGGRQLVILDEADNIHGTYDRGGAQALTRLVKEASQPMVLIANEYYDMSRGLRNACQDVEFRDVSARSILPVLRDICRREDIEYESDALEAIAEANSGDLRGAIKDLQAACEGRSSITLEDVVTGGRDTTVGIFPLLDAILKEASAQEALHTAYDADETPDELAKWVEDKVLKVYEGDEVARAYDHLAYADRWLGRVQATQDYSYWRYVTDNVAAGVAAARDHERGGWTRYGGRPQMWPSSDKVGDEICQSIAETGGMSMATARRVVLPYLRAMIHHCKPRDLTVAVAAALDLDEKGVAYITGSGESTNKVESIVEDARELREAEMEEHAGGAFEPRAENGDEGTGVGDASEGEQTGIDDVADADADNGTDSDTASHDQAQVTLGGDGPAETDVGDPGEDGGAEDDGDSHGDDEDREADDEDREADDEDNGQSGLNDFV